MTRMRSNTAHSRAQRPARLYRQELLNYTGNMKSEIDRKRAVSCYPKVFLCFLLITVAALHHALGDDLSGSILMGGKISYNPPFPMPHYISDGQINYIKGNICDVSFCVMDAIPSDDKLARKLLSETNTPSINELKTIVESQSDGSYIGTNAVVKIIKLDGQEALEIYGKKKGYSGVPEMWSDTICLFWYKDAHWDRTAVLSIGVSDGNEKVCQQLAESVKSAKYYPVK